jgi:hypothetical protein
MYVDSVDKLVFTISNNFENRAVFQNIFFVIRLNMVVFKTISFPSNSVANSCLFLAGCNMIVYNLHSGQFTYDFCSNHLSTADGILLSSSLMIAVELDKVIIWRLQPVTGPHAYETYLNEMCRSDDERDSDESYYNDYDDDKRQDVVQQRVLLLFADFYIQCSTGLLYTLYWTAC